MGRSGRWAGCVAVVAVLGCGGHTVPPATPAAIKVAADVRARRDRFVRQPIDADATKLAPGDFASLDRLSRAAAVADELFRRQAWRGSAELEARLAGLAGPDAAAARDLARIMAGPWDRLDGFRAFVGDAAHPPGAGFYPDGLTAGELLAWVATHPGEAAALESPVTTVERAGDALVAVPYARAWPDQVARLADELDAAGRAASTPSLKRYLASRAEALASGDYARSDLAWLRLDGPVEVVIGPYVAGDDAILGVKASFGAIVGIERHEDTERFAAYAKELPFVRSRLPGAPATAPPPPAAAADRVRIVDELIAGGRARCAPLTVAVALPAAPGDREPGGWKQVVLRNVLRAEYDSVLAPLAARVLAKEDAGNVDLDTFYNHVVFRELARSLGPAGTTAAGGATGVRLALRDRYAPIEEAKADVLAVYGLAVLANRQVVPLRVVQRLPWTYLASLLGAARFGERDARGLAALIQLGYLTSRGALSVDADGRFRPVLERFAGTIRDLARDLLAIEGAASYERAGEWMAAHGTASADVRKALDALAAIPLDVEPVYGAEPKNR